MLEAIEKEINVSYVIAEVSEMEIFWFLSLFNNPVMRTAGQRCDRNEKKNKTPTCRVIS